MSFKKKQKNLILFNRGFEPDVNRTRNLLIWSQTRYHCATDPVKLLCPKYFIVTHRIYQLVLGEFLLLKSQDR